jgi:hypothetical protein
MGAPQDYNPAFAGLSAAEHQAYLAADYNPAYEGLSASEQQAAYQAAAMQQQQMGGQQQFFAPQQPTPLEVALKRADKVEKLHISRLEKDTYAVRRKEGRPKHTTGSMTSCTLAVISWLLQAIAVFMPEWRTDWYGSFGYGTKKSWGLFTVKGETSLTWQEISENTCRWWGSMRTFNSCQSPICHWYFVKCRVYTDMWMISWAVGFALVFGLVIHGVCTVFTFRLTPRSLRWASCWWFMAAILHISGLIAHFIMMEEQFATLQVYSFYPDPDPGVSVVASCLAFFCLVIVVVLGLSLHYSWPEPEYSDSEDEFDDAMDGYDGYKKRDVQSGSDSGPEDRAPRIIAAGGQQLAPDYDARHGDDKAPALR